MSPDDSGHRGRGDGGGPGLGQYEDDGPAGGLRSRAHQTSPAGSGRAIHQKQHVARPGNGWRSRQGAHRRQPEETARSEDASPGERLIRTHAPSASADGV